MNIFIGWDSREIDAYNVTEFSIRRHASGPVNIQPIKKEPLIEGGVYTREQPEAGSVEFTYTRFLTPYLSGYHGWSLFVDCDFLFTRDVAELFALCDDRYAVMCVKHDYTPRNIVKMDGQKQVAYPRKNWSSCVLWNCSHPVNRVLTPELVSAESGAFLHRFQWMDDDLIGEIPLEWNWLEGEYDKPEEVPAIIHYTQGGPWFDNQQDVDYADLWLEEFKMLSE